MICVEKILHLGSSKSQWKKDLLVKLSCLKRNWNSKRPSFYVMGNRRQLLCNKGFLRLKYGQLCKHSRAFWTILSLLVWWTSHEGIGYYLILSIHVLVWHKILKLRLDRLMMFLMFWMHLMLNFSSFKTTCK
jgi:hypothetical protein